MSSAVFALILMLIFTHAWHSNTADAQRQCQVADVSTLMPGDERLIQFKDCPPGIVANVHWTLDSDVPATIPVTRRRLRLDSFDWIIPPESWLIAQMTYKSNAPLWRPTLDVPLTHETQRRLQSTMATRRATATKDIDALWDHLAHFTLVEGEIRSVSKVGERWFINFGEDYRQDFTIGIQGLAYDHLRSVHGRPQNLQGKTIRVVGAIQGFGGPYIALSNGWQLWIMQ